MILLNNDISYMGDDMDLDYLYASQMQCCKYAAAMFVNYKPVMLI